MSGADYGQAWRPGLWLGAAALVLAVHAGGIAWALRQASPPPAEADGGVFLIELAPIATSLPPPPAELPPGPQNVASQETPAVAANVGAVEPRIEPDLPPLPTLATAPPDMTLPERVENPPIRPPLEQVPAEHRQTAADSQESAATLATAPPRIEPAPIAEKAAAPAAGTSDYDKKMRARWEGALSVHLARYGRFPSGVRGLAQDQSVLMRFRLDRKGRIVASEVLKSSGSTMLDTEAMAILARASPLPIPPEQVSGEQIELIVPIKFKARR